MSHRQITSHVSRSQSYRPIMVSLSTYSTRKNSAQAKVQTLARKSMRSAKTNSGQGWMIP